YKVSPLLWDKVRRGLSAGRVQTVALRLIVEREREIRSFQKEEYWTLSAHLKAANPPVFDARLVKQNGQDFVVRGESVSGSIQAQVEKGKLLLANQAETEQLKPRLEKERFVVASTETKEIPRRPPPPFITSTLQQEASRKLNLAAKRTMALAQRLYEGVECGEEGIVGLITYMRTDSTRVSDVALREARELIHGSYGRHYLPPEPNIYRSKKGAQDAHEAIRPTSVSRTPEQVARYLSEDEAKLYRLLWQRFVASQMTSALYDRTTIEITAGEFGLRATGSVLKFDGFLKVYEEAKDQKEEEDEEFGRRLPLVKSGEVLRLLHLTPEQHFTEPPPRYNEARLVKALEEKGIGRPSTYAAILSTIQERDYVQKQAGKWKGPFVPTELGEVVTGLLVDNFEEIFDVAYTAKMEDALDEIEDGKKGWVETLQEFYRKFEKELKRAKKHMADVKRMEEPTDLACEKCGKAMVIKWGRHGKFLACTGYPDCTNTRELPAELSDRGADEEGAAPEAEQTCENCGQPMVLKRGRFGQFLACSGYPDCKTTRQIGQAGKKPPVPTDEKCPKCGNILVIRQGRFGEFTSCSNYPKCKFIQQNSTGVECPECKQGQIVEKRSRRGPFYSCERYPKCKYSLRNKPVAQKCPQCGSAFLLEKTSKSSITLECPTESCDYKQGA
ncbi:MAG: type I DNA topoisomerase, partial [Acidobacteria bacterium]|nr:type I DNA topoisomerase [Acidobacteriota bacterium]